METPFGHSHQNCKHAFPLMWLLHLRDESQRPAYTCEKRYSLVYRSRQLDTTTNRPCTSKRHAFQWRCFSRQTRHRIINGTLGFYILKGGNIAAKVNVRKQCNFQHGKKARTHKMAAPGRSTVYWMSRLHQEF